MTAESTPTSPRSRRALLAGALGGLGVWAASAIGRAAPADAAAGDPIRMGRLNKASSTATTLQTKTSSAAYQVVQIGAGAAVKGVATSGRAILGQASSGGTGVWASSPNHVAVHATSTSGKAVLAETVSGTGLYASGALGLECYGSATAAIFGGPVALVGYQSFHEVSNPPTGANTARVFARDSGGKTQLCVQFGTGAVQVLATEP